MTKCVINDRYTKTLSKVNFVGSNFFDLAKVLATTNSEPGLDRIV